MHFFKENDLSREEDKYIRFIAYDTLIDFDEKSLPVLSEFDHFINSSILILPMQFVARKEDHFVRTYKDIFASPKFMLLSLYQSYHIFHNISNQSLDNN